MIKGTPQFDALAIMELKVSFIGGAGGTAGPSEFVGKAAFVSTATGQTHGFTTGYQWSRETLDKLAELRALMERDLASLHFSDAGMPEQRTGLRSLSAENGGINENLRDESGVSQT